MADLIFVNTEQFEALKKDGVGIFLLDNQGTPMILLDFFVIKISNINENGNYI